MHGNAASPLATLLPLSKLWVLSVPDASQCMSDVTKVRSDAAKMSLDVIKTRVGDYISPSDV